MHRCRSRRSLPGAPPPASVVTTAAAVTWRILLLLVSATYNVPALSTATPRGPLNRAALPVPSVFPDVPARPASVVTTRASRDFPDRVIVGIRHIQDTRAVDGNPPRLIESRVVASRIGSPRRTREARQRGHDAAGRDFPDRVIVGIGDIHRAGAVDGHPSRAIECARRCPCRRRFRRFPPGPQTSSPRRRA